MSSSESVAWNFAAVARSASSNGGGPRRCRLSCIAFSSGVLASRLDTALTTCDFDPRLGHQRRAVSDLAYPLDQPRELRQVARADHVAHLGARLHHVGRDAAGIEQRVVDARVARHVLAHVVDADIHQLHRVQRAAAEMRRGGGM